MRTPLPIASALALLGAGCRPAETAAASVPPTGNGAEPLRNGARGGGETSNRGLSPEPGAEGRAEPAQRQRDRPRSDNLRITSAGLIDARTLRLVFSRPLADTEQVDPAEFRLSTGMSYRYHRYAYAYYYDVGYGYGDATARFVELRRHDERTVDLLLNVELDLELCDELHLIDRDIKLEPGTSGRAGLFLHHASASAGPTITDLQGRRMRDFGAAFVRTPSETGR